VPTVVLTYPETPASSNTNAGVGGRGHPKAVARTKGRWEGLFAMMLLAEGVPRNLPRVSVTAELKFRDRRRRDADNFFFPISKPLGDALVKGGWLADDTPDYYEFERVRISEEKLDHHDPRVKGEIKLTLTWPDDDPALAQAA
jgi:Holliday junction resolvase RusA-like endonuclease